MQTGIQEAEEFNSVQLKSTVAGNKLCMQRSLSASKSNKKLSYTVVHKIDTGQNRWCGTDFQHLSGASLRMAADTGAQKECAQQLQSAPPPYTHTRIFSKCLCVLLCAGTGYRCIVTIWLRFKIKSQRTTNTSGKQFRFWRYCAKHRSPRKHAVTPHNNATQAGGFCAGGEILDHSVLSRNSGS